MNYQDLANLTSLSPKERKKVIHKILTMDNIAQKGIILAGDDDKNSPSMIDINALVETLGMERVEELLTTMLGKQNAASMVLDADDIGVLMSRVESGEATSLEKHLASYVGTHYNHIMESVEKGTMCSSIVTHLLLDVLNYLKVKQNYQAKYYDVILALSTLMLGSFGTNPHTVMYHHKDSDPDKVAAMIDKVSNDILDILKNAWNGKTPPDDIFILGLMGVVEKIVMKMPKDVKVWSNAEEIAKMFDLDLDLKRLSIFDDDDEK